MRWTSRARFLAGAMSVLAGCGGGGGDGGGGTQPGGNGTVSGSFTASIDGQSWTADAATMTVSGQAQPSRPGVVVLAGGQVASGISLSISLAFIRGPGTYPLGVNIGTNAGGIATITEAHGTNVESWNTSLTGAAGTVTITTRTSTRIAGTFSCTATALLGTSPSPASRIVTNGSFDVTLNSGTLPPIPAGYGSITTANLNSTPWNAATIVALFPGPGVFGLTAMTDDYTLLVSPKVPVAAGNTYNVPGDIGLTVLTTGGLDSWVAISGGPVGTVTITTLTDLSVVATYQATLPASAGNGTNTPMVIANGVINVNLDSL